MMDKIEFEEFTLKKFDPAMSLSIPNRNKMVWRLLEKKEDQNELVSIPRLYGFYYLHR